MKRNIGKKIAFWFAVMSFVSAAVTLVVFAFAYSERGPGDTVVASLLATTLFFASCGTVLYMVSKPPQHELLPWDHPEAAHGGAPVSREKAPANPV